jgi:hypothetical protein
MPTVDRVLREITADNPMDAAARRMGAFEQLNEIIEELSMGRTAIGQPTPDETRILGEYRQARYEVQQTQVRTTAEEERLPALRRFDEDPALRDELLNRFLSPALRAQSVAISRQLQARRQAFRQSQAAFGGQAPAPPAAPTRPTPASSASAPPPKPLTPDPSIAKARAANVDTKVFGFQLGEGISLPVCGLAGGFGTAINCKLDSDFTKMADALISSLTSGAGSPKGDLPEKVAIKLAPNNCPTSWMSKCVASGLLEDGRLVGVFAVTDGPSVEQIAARELKGKYGTRFSAQQRFVTQISTGVRTEVWDLEWQLPGLHVEYKVVHEDITKGILRIETETAYARRTAVEKEANKPKL